MEIILPDFIYHLDDPRLSGPEAIFYIGVTDDPKGRYNRHLQCNDPINEYKNTKIKEILQQGLYPVMGIYECLEGGNRSHSKGRERYWIQHCLSKGAPLLNIEHIEKYTQRERSGVVKAFQKSALTPSQATLNYAWFLEVRAGGSNAIESIWQPPIVARLLKSNDLLFWVWGTPNNEYVKEDIWCGLGLLPLAEVIIDQLLRGEKSLEDIRPEDVYSWQTGQAYTCYIACAAYRAGTQHYLIRLFKQALMELASIGVHIEKLYLNAPDGAKETAYIRLVRENFFTPIPDVSETAWVVHLDHFNPSPIIQAYQEELKARR
jgi:hypothetical protein